MQINFTGRNFNVTPALKTLTEDKFSKLEHHFDKITSINVTFNIDNLDQIAEATVLIANDTLHAKAKEDDMYKAVDKLLQKIDRQLIKHKNKLREHRERE